MTRHRVKIVLHCQEPITICDILNAVIDSGCDRVLITRYLSGETFVSCMDYFWNDIQVQDNKVVIYYWTINPKVPTFINNVIKNLKNLKKIQVEETCIDNNCRKLLNNLH